MASSVPYIGSKISLISNAEIRYEGILYTIDTQQSTIALSSVRCFGTEGRKMPPLNPSNEVYDFIIFRGQDIKELTVLDSNRAVNDPAIVSINQKPAGRGGAKGGSTGTGKGSQESSSDTRNKGWGGWGNSNSGGYGSGGGGSSWGGWNSNSNSNNYGSGGGGYGSSGYNNSWSGGGGGGDRSGGGKGGKTDSGKGSGGKRTSDSGKGKSGTKSGKSSGKDGGKSENRKGGDKGKSGGEKGGSKKGNDKGKRSSGRAAGSGNSGIPVGELAPEENAEVKKECAEDFDVTAANEKFDKVSTIEGVDDFDDRLKPLSGYDKATSFFDSISCEATERPAEAERPKVDREKAREFDKETFGDTRRPPRPAGGRPGKGRRRGGNNGKGFRS